MHISRDQRGEFDPLIIPLIVSVFLVLGLAGFGIWSYINFLDQRDNTDQKISEAVEIAKGQQATELEAEFIEREKEPKVTFLSDSAIGSIEFNYPKTWSAFVDSNSSSSKPLSAIFHPKFVPADNTLYALRVFVDESDYSKKVTGYEKDVEDGLVNVKPIKINGVTGIRVNGQIDKDYKGSIVIFPLRDKTVQIWTESESFLKDFNAVIDGLTFEP